MTGLEVTYLYLVLACIEDLVQDHDDDNLKIFTYDEKHQETLLNISLRLKKGLCNISVFMNG